MVAALDIWVAGVMVATVFLILGFGLGYLLAARFAVGRVWEYFRDGSDMDYRTAQRIVGDILGRPAEWCHDPERDPGKSRNVKERKT